MGTKERVRELINYWYPKIGDPRCEVDVFFGEFDERSSVYFDEEYLTVKFYFNDRRVEAELSDGNLEKEVIHEIIHVLVWPLSRISLEVNGNPFDVRRVDEQVVTTLERALYGAVAGKYISYFK